MVVPSLPIPPAAAYGVTQNAQTQSEPRGVRGEREDARVPPARYRVRRAEEVHAPHGYGQHQRQTYHGRTADRGSAMDVLV